MTDLYKRAGSGAWSSASSWSLSSGGGADGSVPTQNDNVFLDANSGTLTNPNGTCRNFDCTGFTGSITGIGVTLAVTGETLTLAAASTVSTDMNWSLTAANATGNTMVITTNGKGLSNVTFNGSGKTFNFADAFNAATTPITLTAGTLNMNGFATTGGLSATITAGVFDTGGAGVTLAGAFNSSNTNARTIDLGGGDLICTALNINATNLTWTAPDSVTVALATTPTGTFVTGGVEIPILNIDIDGLSGARYGGQFLNTGGTLDIGEIAFVGTADANTIGLIFTFASNVTIDKAAWPAGTQLLSTARGTQRTITTGTNQLTATGTAFRDIVISGGPLLAVDSIDLGNNSGITFGNFGANTHEVVGTTLDNAGDPLPSCDVFLMKRVGDELIQAGYVESNAVTGAYTIGAPDNDPDYVVVATKGSPERGDAMGGIQPTVP
jgi:hypothetical protein